MKKVYLAKSNRSNPDDVQKVRKILDESNCETVEYKGGSFSHKAMLECEMLIVVPDLSRYEKDDGQNECDSVGVGKGLYQQVEVFRDEYGDDHPIVIIRDCDSGWDPRIATLHPVDFGEVDDCDDYIDYGWLYVEPTCDVYANLSNSVDDIFGEKDIESTGGSRRSRYLLLGK